jgi:2-polyprenyl-3-methyl-5-hydroxy-6-metoxy-1,4-benzoquinol methylase
MPVSTETRWRNRMYAAYVSSGQARSSASTAEKIFADRSHYINQIIHRYLPSDRDTRILDLGCGHGAFVYFLRQNGYTSVIGVDVSKEQVDLASRLGIAAITQETLLECLSTRATGSVGCILMIDILEHLTRSEAFAVIEQVHRVLKNGAKCILHVPNAEGIFGMRVRYGDITHEVSYTQGSASQLLTTVGFKKICCYEDKPIPHGIFSLFRRIIWDLGTAWHRLLLFAETGSRGAILSQNLLVVAHK